MAGIKDILIPIKVEDLTIEKVMPYLPRIMDAFRSNSQKIRKDYDTYCLEHDILNKTRPHGDADVNNIVIEPHLAAMIDWKVGYIFGFPMKYAQSEEAQTDDIKYLNKYVRNWKRKVDRDVGMWAFATGVGYYFIEPRKRPFDTEHEAPFTVYCREADSCFKVKSAYAGNEPLFDVLYAKHEITDQEGRNTTIEYLDVYFPRDYYLLQKDSLVAGDFKVVDHQKKYYSKLPLVEKKLHNGIGIVSMFRSLQYALDMLSSNNLDNLQDVVNVIYKYKGIATGETAEAKTAFHRGVVKNGAIEIPYQSGTPFPADLEIESVDALKLEDVNIFKTDLKRTMYETAGVPLATSDTNSGGTTKSGSEVANGYENAYNRALDNVNDFIVADYELLEKMLWICNHTSNNKIDNLHASEIEIKYCLNLTDNILTKMQALVYAKEIGMPYNMALEKTKMSNDSDAEGKLWEAFAELQERKAQENSTNGNNGDNAPIDTTQRSV